VKAARDGTAWQSKLLNHVRSNQAKHIVLWEDLHFVLAWLSCDDAKCDTFSLFSMSTSVSRFVFHSIQTIRLDGEVAPHAQRATMRLCSFSPLQIA
jgi:hypothetical protein